MITKKADNSIYSCQQKNYHYKAYKIDPNNIISILINNRKISVASDILFL